MSEVHGYALVARVLRQLGVTHVYSVTGAPIVETVAACSREGIRPIGARNEQAEVMMAAAQNYVAGHCVGVPVLASGPAVTNAVTGVLVARDNCWPLVVMGGRTSLNMSGMGAFQELDAVPIFGPITKWSAVVETTARIPEYLARAFQTAMYGQPGPVYLDLPQDVLQGTIPEEKAHPVEWRPQPPSRGDSEAIRQAAELLLNAERPAVILGKGVRWSEPYEELRQLVEALGLPFLTSPMGRGFLPDDHPLCFNPTRSFLQRNADVVLLLGTRLNWIFRFGSEFPPDAKVVQVDIEPLEIGHNRAATVGIVGDTKEVLRQLLAEMEGKTAGMAERAAESPWLSSLREKRDENEGNLEQFLNSDAVPMSPHRMFKEVREFLPRDGIAVVDGNVTLGAARQVLPSYTPVSRLNSGSNGCMGVGVPFGIGAKLANPDRPVVSINGDCAFGFSAMEMETAVRHNIPVVFVVANNEGISGANVQDASYPEDYPERVAMYSPDLRYEGIMAAFGGHTEYVERPEELKPALERAVASGKAACVHVKLDPRAPYPGPGGRPRNASVMMSY